MVGIVKGIAEVQEEIKFLYEIKLTVDKGEDMFLDVEAKNKILGLIVQDLIERKEAQMFGMVTGD